MATAGPPVFTYVGAKCLAEKAAWDFVDNEKPDFRLVTLTPPLVHLFVRPELGLRTVSAGLWTCTTARRFYQNTESILWRTLPVP